MKKVLLFVITLILLTSLTFAIETTDFSTYTSFDVANTSGNTMTDWTGNLHTATCSFTGGNPAGQCRNINITGIVKNGTQFEADGGTIDVPYDSVNVSENSFIYAWLKTNATAGADGDIVSNRNSANGRSFAMYTASTEATCRFRKKDNTGSVFLNSGINVTDDSWHMIICSLNGTHANIYVDGVKRDTSAITNGRQTATPIRYGGSPDGTMFIRGQIDEVGMGNYNFTDQDAIDLYNGGNYQNPFVSPANVSDVHYIPRVAVVDQGGPVNVNSFTYIQIYTAQTEIENKTNVSLGVTGYVTGNGQTNCRALFNGTEVGKMQTSPQSNTERSFYINSELIEVEPGTYNVSLECKKDSPQPFTIDYSKMLITEYINEGGESLKSEFNEFSTNVTSSTFQLLASYNYTTSNKQTLNLTQFLLFEGSANFFYDSSGTICIRASALGINSSDYCRYGGVGTTGSGAAFDLIINTTKNVTIPIDIYGRSTTSDGSVNLSVINFDILEDVSEVNETKFVQQNITSSSFQVIKSVNISQSNHFKKTTVAKASFSIQSNSGSSNVQFRLTLTGNQAENGTPIIRNINSANQEGIIIIQEVFEDLPTGDYKVNVEALASNSDVTITDGHLVVYSADPELVEFLGFEIFAQDGWDNSQIDNFSVVFDNGNVFSTTTGNVTIFTTTNPINFTVNSSFNGGYFETRVLNHNSSQNVTVDLNQTLTRFNATTLITNVPVDNVTFFINGISLDVFNLKAGDYNVTAVASGWFNGTTQITVAPLFNGTKTVSSLHNLRFNLSAQSAVDSSTINIFSGVITNVLFSYSANFNTGTGSVLVPALQNYSYNIQLNSIANFSDFNNSVSYTAAETLGFSEINHTFNLYTNNSIKFTILYLDNLSLADQPVELFLEGSTISYNFSTNNGSLYVDGLNDDTYQLTSVASGFSSNILFITLQNNGHQNVVVYLQSQLKSVDFIVQDDFLNTLDGTTLTFFQNINGSLVTVVQALTDFSGRATVLLNESIRYTFISVKEDFVTFQGEVLPTQNEYTITMFSNVTTPFESIFDDVTYRTPFNYILNETWALVEFIINSASGSLQWYGMTTTYLGQNFSINRTGFPAGGTETFNITTINPLLQNQINVTYFFKVVGRDSYTFSSIFYLDNTQPTNLTLETGLFDDILNSDQSSLLPGAFGAGLVLLLIILFGASTKNVTVGIVAGMGGVWVNYNYLFWPTELCIVTLIASLIFLIADNLGGGGSR